MRQRVVEPSSCQRHTIIRVDGPFSISAQLVPKSVFWCPGAFRFPSQIMDRGRHARAMSIPTPRPFGYTVADVLQVPRSRRFDIVELWSGKGTIARAAKAAGHEASTFDKDDDKDEDILTKDDFEVALELVLRLRPGGLLWMAPVCSSFCWLYASHALRNESNDFAGDITNKKVKQGNQGADIAAFLFVVAWGRGAEACIENPPGSTIWRYRPIANVLSGVPQLANTVAHRCYFDTNPFGKRYLKEYKLWATGVWVLDLGMKCRCPDKVHKPTVKRNGAAVTGKSADLKATQTYPNKFGIAIVKAWEAGRFDPPPPTIRLHTESSASSQGAEESDDGSPTFRCSGAASSEGGQGCKRTRTEESPRFRGSGSASRVVQDTSSSWWSGQQSGSSDDEVACEPSARNVRRWSAGSDSE